MKSLHTDAIYQLRINSPLTDIFNANKGLRQGDKPTISHILFSLYTNDVVGEVIVLKCGVELDS